MAALDPNFKLAYAKAKWDSEYFEAGVARLECLVSICIILVTFINTSSNAV